jgi:hypothetical protein
MLARWSRFVKISALSREIRDFNIAGFQLDQSGLPEKLLPTADESALGPPHQTKVSDD